MLVTALVVGALSVSAVPVGQTLTSYQVQGGNRQTVQLTVQADSLQGNEGERLHEIQGTTHEAHDVLQPSLPVWLTEGTLILQ